MAELALLVREIERVVTAPYVPSLQVRWRRSDRLVQRDNMKLGSPCPRPAKLELYN